MRSTGSPADAGEGIASRLGWPATLDRQPFHWRTAAHGLKSPQWTTWNGFAPCRALFEGGNRRHPRANERLGITEAGTEDPCRAKLTRLVADWLTDRAPPHHQLRSFMVVDGLCRGVRWPALFGRRVFC